MADFANGVNATTSTAAAFSAHNDMDIDEGRGLDARDILALKKAVREMQAVLASNGLSLTTGTPTATIGSTTGGTASLDFNSPASTTSRIRFLSAGTSKWEIFRDANLDLNFYSTTNTKDAMVLDDTDASVWLPNSVRFGTGTEGYSFTVVDEDVDASSAAAAHDLAADIPDGAVILCVQANLDTAITGATAVKVGVGVAADPDKYGLTSGLTQNLKIDTLPAHAVLSGAEDVQVYACDTNGDAAGTIGGAGEIVRVRIVYATTNSLDDA